MIAWSVGPGRPESSVEARRNAEISWVSAESQACSQEGQNQTGADSGGVDSFVGFF